MRISVAAIIVSLSVAATAYAQSPSAPVATDSATPATATSATAAAVPVPSGKRFACHTASQGLKGQDQRDQMQLCMAQARIDCLKQAIDQKIVGPPRKDFVKTCTE
jgi:hypothetical protein